jgi:tetratricopeptide (TPR) repeat protein
VLQKRSEGTSMKRAEFRELANLYEFAADMAPDDPKAISRHHYTQGTLALLDGKLQAALQSIRRSIDYDPNWAPAFNDLGKVYVRLNDYPHAEESYEKAIQAQPNWVFPQLNLAGIYLHNKEWPRAEQAYVKAADLDKTLATTWYFLGQVYEAEARSPDAINAYEHAIELAASRPSSAFSC